MLEHSEADVLILLDCCAAGSSIAAAGSGVTEVIAACGFESRAPGVGEHSFTRSLIEELRYCSHGPPLSVAMLHNKVPSRIKYWKPRFGTTGYHEHRKTPIYIVLANEGMKRSIELAPIPYISVPVREFLTGSNQTSLSSSSQSSLDQVWPDPNFGCPKVLITVALEDDQLLRTGTWMDWLKSVPGVVKYTEVQGVWRSDSTIILLSMAIAMWDLLPKNPAVKFLGFVRSYNLLHTEYPLITARDGTKISNTFSHPGQLTSIAEEKNIRGALEEEHVARSSNASKGPFTAVTATRASSNSPVDAIFSS